MARPKGTSPPRGPGVPVRFTATERRYIEAARDKEYRDDLRDQGVSELALAAFLRAGAFERAARILGLTLADFEAKEKRSAGHK
jgi:hypothetical protein